MDLAAPSAATTPDCRGWYRWVVPPPRERVQAASTVQRAGPLPRNFVRVCYQRRPSTLFTRTVDESYPLAGR